MHLDQTTQAKRKQHQKKKNPVYERTQLKKQKKPHKKNSWGKKEKTPKKKKPGLREDTIITSNKSRHDMPFGRNRSNTCPRKENVCTQEKKMCVRV